MKVLLNALSAREGGGVRYLRSLLPALARVAPRHRIDVLHSRTYQADLLDGVPETVGRVAVDLAATPLARRWLVEQVRVPRLLDREGYDALWTPTEVGTIRPRRPHLVTAQNPNFFAPIRTHDDLRGRLYLLRYRASRQPLANATLRRADRVVFVSGVFRDQVVAQLGLDAHRTRVVHHGLAPAFFAEAPPNALPPALAGREYLLSVSTLTKHKNHEGLVEAFARLRRPLHLAIAGAHEDPGIAGRVERRAAAHGVADRVHLLGRVPETALVALYRHAAAFVFPSRLETFGMPLAEAMASGVPIVASDLPVCREVCGDAAAYAPHGDPDAIAAQIARLLDDPEHASTLVKRGRERARTFSWDACAEAVAATLDELEAR